MAAADSVACFHTHVLLGKDWTRLVAAVATATAAADCCGCDASVDGCSFNEEEEDDC